MQKCRNKRVKVSVHHKLRVTVQLQDTLKKAQFKRWVFSREQQRHLKLVF